MLNRHTKGISQLAKRVPRVFTDEDIRRIGRAYLDKHPDKPKTCWGQFCHFFDSFFHDNHDIARCLKRFNREGREMTDIDRLTFIAKTYLKLSSNEGELAFAMRKTYEKFSGTPLFISRTISGVRGARLIKFTTQKVADQMYLDIEHKKEWLNHAASLKGASKQK